MVLAGEARGMSCLAPQSVCPSVFLFSLFFLLLRLLLLRRRLLFVFVIVLQRLPARKLL